MVNSKLRQWKFSNPAISQMRKSPRGSSDALILITQSKPRNGRVPVAFKLSAALRAQAAFVPGDIIDLSYDDGVVVLYRDNNGRAMHQPSTSGRATVEFVLPPKYAKLFDNKRASCVEAERDRVAFVLA